MGRSPTPPRRPAAPWTIFFFPGEGWNDFVVVIIAWWLGALEQLERDARGDEATLRFMDGPYWITLTPQEDDLAQLRCFEDRRGAGVLHEEWVNLPEFVAQVRGIARHVLSACDQAGIASSDVDALKRQLGR